MYELKPFAYYFAELQGNYLLIVTMKLLTINIVTMNLVTDYLDFAISLRNRPSWYHHRIWHYEIS
jgi:hypothetical protein